MDIIITETFCLHKIGNTVISNIFFLVEWSLVAEKKECDGSEAFIGWVSTLEECAKKCVWSSMFIYGTNDFGSNKCGKSSCKCYCEKAASAVNTCNQIDHSGYRLYQYKIAGNLEVYL